MKIASTLLACVAVLSLAGCASSGNSASLRGASYAPSRVDAVRIAYVEQVARQKGVQVVWVNPPEKKRIARNP